MASSPTAPLHPESAFASVVAVAASAPPPVAISNGSSGNLLLLSNGYGNVSFSGVFPGRAALLSTSSSEGGLNGRGSSSQSDLGVAAAAAAAPPPIDRPESVPAPERTVSGYCRALFGSADVLVDHCDDDVDERPTTTNKYNRYSDASKTTVPPPLPAIKMKRARSMGLGRVPSVDLTAVAAAAVAANADSDAAATPAPPPPPPPTLPQQLPPQRTSSFAIAFPPAKAARASFEEMTSEEGALVAATATTTATTTTTHTTAAPFATTTPPPVVAPRPPSASTRSRSAAAAAAAAACRANKQLFPSCSGTLLSAAEIARALPRMPTEVVLPCGSVARLEATLWRRRRDRSSTPSPSPSRVFACVSVAATVPEASAVYNSSSAAAAVSAVAAGAATSTDDDSSSEFSEEEREQCTFALAMTLEASVNPRIVTTGLAPFLTKSKKQRQWQQRNHELQQRQQQWQRRPGSAALSGRVGVHRAPDVNVLELLFLKREREGRNSSCSLESRCWHLSGPLPASRPLPEAPSRWCWCESDEEGREEKEEDENIVIVDVAARVSDGAGGGRDLWIQAKNVVLRTEEP